MADGNNRIIIFDFDGVIVDSFQTALEAQKIVRSGMDFSEDDYRKLFEGNVFEEQVRADKASKEKFDLQKFFDIYLPRFFELPAIEGIREALNELSKKYKLIIISSTTSEPISEWLRRRELMENFTEVMGGDVHQSKIEKIKMVFEKYGVGTSDCILITDTLGDLLEANHVGIGSLAVTYGFHGQELLQKGNPAGFIREPRGILETVEEFWKEAGGVLEN